MIKIFGTIEGKETENEWEGFLDAVNHGKNIFTY